MLGKLLVKLNTSVCMWKSGNVHR